MNKLLNKIIEYSFYALFIIVPLILTPYNYELFEFNKMLTVYFITVIITSAWIIKMIINQKIIFQKTPFTIPLIIFLISQTLSTLFSIDPHTSLWGYYSRFHGGLISTISYLLLYFTYVGFGTFRCSSSEPNEFNNRIIKVILSTALIVSIYGILEHFGIDKNLWVQDVQTRVFSTLGQPNWLAAYLLTLIPISLSLSLKNPKYHLVTLTFFITLLFTKSRSGLLGLGLAWSIYWLLILLKNKLKSFPVKPFLTINFLFLLAILIIGTPWSNPWFRTSKIGFGTFSGLQGAQRLKDSSEPEETSRSLPEVSDLGPPTIQTGGSKSSDIRKVVWQGAINIWEKYPIFGSGVETFAYSYYNHRPVEHNLLSEWDFLYNKAHNEFLNFLATTGAFGLFSYLLIIIWFSIWTLRIYFRSRSCDSLYIALLAGYLGLAVSNFFGFSVVPVALFFFLFPALAISHNMTKGDTLTGDARESRVGTAKLEGVTLIKILITLSLATFFLYSIITMWQADRAFVLGKNYLQANQIQTGYAYLQKAVTVKPNQPLFRSLYSESAAKMALLYQEDTNLKGQLIEESINNSNLVISQNKVHLNYYKSRAKVFFLLAQIDKKYHQDALNTLLKAIDLSPTDPKLHYNLGLLYTQLGQTKLAEQTLLETINLKPNYETFRNALGSLYQQTNRPDLASEQFEYILKYLNPENQAIKEKLNSLL
ncbi:O-antigen ligase family protein [Patescibacteria group bacterium]|nr:O-antigen ligase family protein [Patescibacteria group bacterium]